VTVTHACSVHTNADCCSLLAVVHVHVPHQRSRANLTMHIYKHALHAAAPPLAKATVAVGLLLASVRLSSRRRATASYVQTGRTPAVHMEVQGQQTLSPLSAVSVLDWPTSYAWVQHPGVLLAGLVCSTVGVVTLQAAAAAAATTTIPVTAVAAAAAAAVSACMMWPSALPEEVGGCLYENHYFGTLLASTSSDTSRCCSTHHI
jgi:hypothetical protein